MSKWICVLLGAWMGCMLTFPQAAMAAAWDGMTLFCSKVFPALFPMLTLMLLITSRLTKAVPVSVVLSLLSGSPGGAKLCAGLPLAPSQKNRLAALTGTMSPMFLLSSLPVIMDMKSGIPMLICHLTGALLSALFCCPFRPEEKDSPSLSPAALSLSNAIWEALSSMGVVLGCITLASVLFAMLHCALPFLPEMLFALLHPLMEVTSGLKTLSDSPLPEKEILAVLFTAFGGLSIQMQNAAFWKKGGVGIMRLLIYRLVHAIISGMLYILLFGPAF